MQMTVREWLFLLVALISLAALAANVYISGQGMFAEPADHRPATIRILKQQEGFRGDCYNDGFGNDTIGYGTKLPLTELEAAGLVVTRLAYAESTLAAQWPPYDRQPAHVQQALALMAYQLGVAGELQFKKMLSCLEQGDRQCAAREALDSKWEHQTPQRAHLVAAWLVGHE